MPTAWLRTQLVEKEAARRALLESLVAAEEDERFQLKMNAFAPMCYTLRQITVQ